METSTARAAILKGVANLAALAFAALTAYLCWRGLLSLLGTREPSSISGYNGNVGSWTPLLGIGNSLIFWILAMAAATIGGAIDHWAQAKEKTSLPQALSTGMLWAVGVALFPALIIIGGEILDWQQAKDSAAGLRSVVFGALFVLGGLAFADRVEKGLLLPKNKLSVRTEGDESESRS